MLQNQLRQSQISIQSKVTTDTDSYKRLNDEVQRLRLQFMQSQQECETWKVKYSQVDLTVQSKHESTLKRLFEMENELNEWRNRYSLLEKMKDQELENFKFQQEARRKSLLNRELREMTLKFQADKASFIAENNRLKEVLDLRALEIEEINQNYLQLDNDYNLLKRNQQKSFEFEEKNKSLIKEIELVSYNLSIKSSQFEKLERERRDFELNQSSKFNELQNVIQYKEKQISDLFLQLNRYKEQESEFFMIQSQLKDHESSRMGMQGEIQRLNQVIQEKISMYESLSQQYNGLNIDFVQRDQNLKMLQDKLAYTERQYQSITLVMNENKNEVKMYAEKLISYENQIKDLTYKNKELQNNVQWISQDLQSQKQKLADQSQIIIQLRQSESDGHDLQIKVSLMSQEIERMTQILQKKSQEYDSVQLRNMELIKQVNYLQSFQDQSKQYEIMITQFNKETERLQRMYSDKQREYDTLILERNELKMFQTRCYDYENIINNMKRELDDYKGHYGSYQVLQQNYSEQKSTIVMLSNEIDRHKSILDQSQMSVEQWRSRCNQYEQTIYQLKEENNNIGFLSEEIDRLQKLHHEKDIDISQFKQRYIDFNSLNNRIKEDMSLFVILFAEIESLRSRQHEKENEITQFRNSQLSSIMVKKI